MGGEKISQEKNAPTGELIYDAYVIGLNRERTHLYARINERVDKMFDDGLVEEVRSLLARGLDRSCQAMQGIGYKEVAAALNGEMTLAQARERIKQATRHFAKRQLTWYRKMPYIHWYDVESCGAQDLLTAVSKDIAGKFGTK